MVSEYSSVIKSNPYVVPFDLNLASQVMMYKDAQFKQNAQAIQSQLNTASSLDLKEADKAKLNQKLSSAVSQLNELGGLDLANIGVANQLQGVVSNLYDDDLLTGVSLKKNYNKLSEYYTKLLTDPKMAKLYSPANYAADMGAASQWLNSDAPTTKEDLAKVPSSPSPYVDLMGMAKEYVKEMKANVVEHPSKRGWYLDQVTNEEISPQRIQNEMMNVMRNDPRMLRQAQINTQYLYGQKDPSELYTEIQTDYVGLLEDQKEQLKKAEVEMLGLSGAEKEAAEKNKKILEKNIEALEFRKQKATLEDVSTHKETYLMDMYMQGVARTAGNLWGYTKTKIVTELDPVQNLEANIQKDMNLKGLVAFRSDAFGGFSVQASPELQQALSTSAAKDGSGSAATTTDVLSAGAPSTNIGTPVAENYTADKAFLHLTELSQADEAAVQQLIKNAVASDPNAASLLGSGEEASREIVSATLGKGAEADRLDIEDLRAYQSMGRKGSQAQFIGELVGAFDDLKRGVKPRRALKNSDIQILTEMHNRSIEKQVLLDMYKKAVGGKATAGLSQAESVALERGKSGDPIYKPQTITIYPAPKTSVGQQVSNAITIAQNPWVGAFQATVNPLLDKAKRAAYEIQVNSIPKTNRLSVIEVNNMYVPANGQDNTFNIQGVGTKKTQQITIPKAGIPKQNLEKLLQENQAAVVSFNKDSKGIYNLIGVDIVKTRGQQDYVRAQEKVKQSQTTVKDPKAFDMLNQTLNYANYLYLPDSDIQKNPGFVKAKALINGELRAGNYPQNKYYEITPGEDNKVIKTPLVGPLSGKENTALDFSKASITRIGKTSGNVIAEGGPVDVELEVPYSYKSGDSTKEGKKRIVAKLSADEVSSTLGIKMQDRTEQIKQFALDYYGRTQEMLMTPTSVQAPQLTFGMYIIKDQATPGAPINYVPQIKIPRADNPKEFDYYPLPDFTGTTPNDAQLKLQVFLDAIAKSQKAQLDNITYPVTNTAELFQLLKLKSTTNAGR